MNLTNRFHIYQCRNVGIWNFAHKFALRDDSLAHFLCNSQHLYASTGTLHVFNFVTFGRQTTKLYAFSLSVAFFSQIFNSP